ncbi:MAG: DUF4112 domain-containing protein [Verrucomicrobiae bacterium]|nr:DUF4112 domain-containing protein [Verrucomicrobiae bacterium]
MKNSEPEPDFIEVDEVIMPDREGKGNTKSRIKGNARKDPVSGSSKSGQSNQPEIPRSPIAKLLSFILDEAFVIPGTKVRIGLDPILGLIPGGGEAIASIAGAFIIGEAYRKGVSIKTVGHMAGNLLLNAGVGAIPGLGDAFSIFFKSNKKNYQILDDFLKNPPPMGKPRRLWPIVVGLGLVALAINIAVWMTVYFLFSTLFNF